MQKILTIQIVGWNSAKCIRRAVGNLAGIPADEVTIRYIDNASDDDSVSIVQEALQHADIVELNENRGFAGAHNIGFSRCTTPLVLTHDPDVELNWEGVKRLLKAFDNEKVGAVQGKLLRSKVSKVSKSSKSSKASKSNTDDLDHSDEHSDHPVIDSAGIVLDLALNGKERGAGEQDRGQYNESADLTAVTGACGLYRLEALKNIAYKPYNQKTNTTCLNCEDGSCKGCLEVFDKDFFSYKEDIDLGWRLNKAGWKIRYEPVLMGIHHRTLGKRGKLPWYIDPTQLGERLRSPRTRYSLRNYVWTLVKNMTWKQELLHEPFIFARLGYWFMLTLVYPSLFSVWGEIVRGIPKMTEKRIQQRTV